MRNRRVVVPGLLLLSSLLVCGTAWAGDETPPPDQSPDQSQDQGKDQANPPATAKPTTEPKEHVVPHPMPHPVRGRPVGTVRPMPQITRQVQPAGVAPATVVGEPSAAPQSTAPIGAPGRNAVPPTPPAPAAPPREGGVVPISEAPAMPEAAPEPAAAPEIAPEEAIAKGEATRRYPKDEPVYYRYLDPARPLDRAILDTLEKLGRDGWDERSDLHNDLGVLLLRFHFEGPAKKELKIAIRKDRKNHVAWYNLGLAHELDGDTFLALRDFRKCVDLKPGHADALFHIGLIEEDRGSRTRAIESYAKSYFHEPRMLDPVYNPLILKTRLIAETLAYSGPRRSLAIALPVEYLDGSRILPILGQAPRGIGQLTTH